MTNEQYIEHEVKLRVMDARFMALEKAVNHIDSKLNWIIGIFITSIVLPVVLHALKLV